MEQATTAVRSTNIEAAREHLKAGAESFRCAFIRIMRSEDPIALELSARLEEAVSFGLRAQDALGWLEDHGRNEEAAKRNIDRLTSPRG
jgi:hypothetical protein